MTQRLSFLTPSQAETNAQIGRLIRKHRRAKNLTQSDLATVLNVTWQTVSKWETGYIQIGAAKLSEIADALGMSIQWLYPVSGPQEVVPAKYGNLRA